MQLLSYQLFSYLSVVILTLSSSALSAPNSPKGAPLKILSDRTPSHLDPLIEQFKRETGSDVQVLYVDTGILVRLKSQPLESDLLIVKDADILEIAKKDQLLGKLTSQTIEHSVRSQFRDQEGYYFSDSYRARVIYFSPDRIPQEGILSYKDLGKPQWKRKICIRSGYDEYNLNLFSQWILSYGESEARELIRNLHSNLALPPRGNDREQVKNIFEKKCDIAIANSYYMGIMLTDPNQKSWGLSSKILFPDQDEQGTFILRSGIALTNAQNSRSLAIKFAEYLVLTSTQQKIAYSTFAYPVIHDSIPLPQINQELGSHQLKVKKGVFKIYSASLSEIAKNREKVIRWLNELNFDSVPLK